MAVRVDCTGERYGKLTAIRPAFSRDGKWWWECRCDCGRNHTVKAVCLRNGTTKSCGCEHFKRPPRSPLADRFWSKVSVGSLSGCWEWAGAKVKGYGRFGINGKQLSAHRYAYERLVGPIPTGLTIDHLCRNTACVNPSHLEPVTAVENVMRGNGYAAINARKTHCVRGHALTPENTHVHKGARTCIECRRMHGRKGAVRLSERRREKRERAKL